MFARIFVNGFPVDKAIPSLSSFLCIIEYIRFETIRKFNRKNDYNAGKENKNASKLKQRENSISRAQTAF